MRDAWAILALIVAFAVVFLAGWNAGKAGASEEYTATVFTIASNAEVENPAPTPRLETPTLQNTPEIETPVPTVAAIETWPTDRALTRDEMRSLLYAAGFPQWTHGTAKRIAWCESRFKPWATGAAGEYSIFQIHPIHIARFQGRNPYDPLTNARVAYEIWSESGFRPWSCY